MEKFNQSIIDVIGNTPIVRINKLATHVESNIYCKLEFMNPGGSIKDRIGVYMCQKAMESGKLKPGGTIVEATSGNTGMGIALFAAVNNCKIVFVMADKQSPEKISALKAMGAKVVVCPTDVEPEDERSYYSVAKNLADNLDNCFYANQYHNEHNPETHYKTTGPEIFEQTQGKFDVFMAGVGTGGTISGTGAYLKTVMQDVKVVGVDIEGSIIAHFHKTGEACEAKPYLLEGLGEDFLPSNIKFEVIDDFVVVGDKESFHMTRRLLTEEGIYAGGSCGAAICGAIKYAEKLETPKDILVILPDSGSRYLSKLYNDQWLEGVGHGMPELDIEFKKDVQTLLPKQDVKLM